MQPTAEQIRCQEAFDSTLDCRINAYAGTGKTTTLKYLSANTKRRGTYLAFNKAVAEEARASFPRNVSCATTHSMAFRSVIGTYGDAQKLVGNVNAGYLAARLKFKDQMLAPNVKMTGRGRGFLISETLKSWQRSGYRDIHVRNVPLAGALKALPDSVVQELSALIVRDARDVWSMMLDPSNNMPMGHDGYLKLWALSNPTIPGDFVLLDEAQDTNGVVMGVVSNLDSQLVCVGDRHQQIYEWRGARNAMSELPADIETRLSTSFRFGPDIAGFATRILAALGETLPLTGNSARVDTVGLIDGPRAILARTNGRLLEELMSALAAGRRPHIVGGTGEVLSWLQAAESLVAGVPVESPIEFFGFKDWAAVQEAADSEEGGDLKRIVRTIQAHGVEQLRSAMRSVQSTEAGADLILATGHKAKGREWASVRLCDDFMMGVAEPKEGAPPADHSVELRLFYVAATRGQEALDVPPALMAKLRLAERHSRTLVAA